MPQATTEDAAALLLGVRRGGPRIAGLGAAAPADAAGAWAVQAAILRQRGGRIGGWKCATPPGKPSSGAMLDAAGIVPSPARWTVMPGETIGIETEIAFRFGRGLPPRATPYSTEEVLDAVEGCFPAIEMVVSRYGDPSKVSLAEGMADSLAHAGLVCGADVPDWRDRALADLTVRQSHGGVVQVEKPGGNPSGGPFPPMVWLANHLPSLGLQIEAGQVVTTGSCTGLLWVASHRRVVGEFLGFGAVVVDLV
jgi:2-keto-4-pentenoate hydratase